MLPARRLDSAEDPHAQRRSIRGCAATATVAADAVFPTPAQLDAARHFAGLFETAITAGDQARLFYRLDRLLPRRHRAYARSLLGGVVAQQRWGVPRAARGRFHVLIRGGWRTGLVHQGARVEWRGHHLALAVLTVGSPSMVYGERTIQGIAERLLSPVSVALEGSAVGHAG